MLFSARLLLELAEYNNILSLLELCLGLEGGGRGMGAGRG